MDQPQAPDSNSPQPAPQKKSISCLMAAALAFLLVVVLAVGAWFWFTRPIKPVELSQQEVEVIEDKISNLEPKPEEPVYEKGSKEIVLTERELNGLLNENTDLGDQLKFQLGTDEVHARIDTLLDPDVPALGGKRLKAKARFLVSTVDSRPSLVLDDLTVWGVSVPNDWLAGMKGKDLLTEVFGDMKGLRGIEDIRIQPGKLTIKLAE